MIWNLSEAKNRLSELLDRARREGPQTITRRDDTFVLLRADQYELLAGKKPSFTDWLLNGPRLDELDLPPRDASTMRQADFSEGDR